MNAEEDPDASAEHSKYAPATRASLATLLPRHFATVVGWTAGLIVLGLGVWLLSKVVALVEGIVVPSAVAVLFVALLNPLNRWFRRHGLPRVVSALLSVLLLLVVIAGVGTLTGFRVAGRFDQLVEQFQQSVGRLQTELGGLGLPVNSASLQQLVNRARQSLTSAGAGLGKTLVTATTDTIHVVVGVVVGLFEVIFLLWDGDRVWSWFIGLFSERSRTRVREAGTAAWVTASGWVQGTFVVAVIHSVVIGVTLALIGTPLLVPLVILVFIGSFVPVIGMLLAGLVAVLITLGTKGLAAAIILLIVIIVENELEAHVLQPLIVGRYVRLHPLAIILVLTAGSYLGGLAGAVFAVPVTGVLRSIWNPLNGRPSLVATAPPSRLSVLLAWIRRRRHRAPTDV